jgi:two-component system chemotaxis response regulator CheY
MNPQQSSDVDVGAVRILVVDDDPFIRNMVRRLLEKMGVAEISEAEDGADGLKQLSAGEPDLVVLDIMMENMNGLQFLKALRTGLSGYRRELPVVVLTGASDEAVMGTALALDCDAFLRKPEGLNELEDRIARVLKSPQEIQPSSAYRAVTVPDLVERAPPPQAPDPAPVTGGGVPTPVYEVEPGAVLDRDLVSPEGHLLLAAGAVVTAAYLNRLSDIAEMIDLPDLWVRPA